MKLSKRTSYPFNPCPTLDIFWTDADMAHAISYFSYKFESGKPASYIHLDGRFYKAYLDSIND